MADKNHLAEAAFIEEKVAEFSTQLSNAEKEIVKKVKGQDNVVHNTLICMVAGGHMLAIGAPGLAKTLLVSSVANVMGLDSKRTQFTPDMLPSDILGAEILETDENGNKGFKFLKGPIFTQFFMADEINRASPRTQSALLEAMQEKHVTMAGVRYPLSHPFHVMATQNPLEQEGTYPLPEAQLDRFLMKIDFDYPDRESERWIMRETTTTKEDLRALFERSANGEDLTNPETYIDKDNISQLSGVLGPNDLLLMQKLAMKLPLSKDVEDAALEIVRRARPFTADAAEDTNEFISWGPGPRALQAFSKAAKARAMMDGRLAPNVDDILALVDPVMEHRMALSPKSRSADVDFQHIKKILTRGI